MTIGTMQGNLRFSNYITAHHNESGGGNAQRSLFQLLLCPNHREDNGTSVAKSSPGEGKARVIRMANLSARFVL